MFEQTFITIDSLTQIVLGASVGEAVAGKKACKKAAIWGAIAGTIPDLDVIPGMFMDIVHKNDFHRGFSHSILFFVLLSPVLGWLIQKIHPKEKATVKDWTVLVFLGLLTHSLLDCFTTWGTSLFWPSDWRIAFKSIFVIDPVYTLPFIVLLLLALREERDEPIRRLLNYIGLGMSTLYLLFTLVNKQIINNQFESELKEQGIEAIRFETKPSPLNNILWTATAEVDSGYFIGYYSFFDNNDSKVDFQFYPKNWELLNGLEHFEDIKTIQRISEGYYTVKKNKTGLVINDLRFGTIEAWDKGDTFVFAYHVTFDEHGELLITEMKKKLGDGLGILSRLIKRVFAIET